MPHELIVNISTHDVAFAIMQGVLGLKAPTGTSPEGALREAAKSEPDMVKGFYRAARNVVELIMKEVNEKNAVRSLGKMEH